MKIENGESTEKLQSAPRALTSSASKGNPLPIATPIVPPIRNLQQKPSTPTQHFTRKTTKEVVDENKMKTSTNITKKKKFRQYFYTYH